MAALGFLGLPNEVIQNFIFKYLEDVDIYKLGQTGNYRLKEMCEHYVQIGKYTYTKKSLPGMVHRKFERR